MDSGQLMRSHYARFVTRNFAAASARPHLIDIIDAQEDRPAQ